MTEENKIQRYKPGALEHLRTLSAVAGKSSEPSSEEEMDLRHIVQVLRNHFRTVMTMAIAVMALALVVSLFMKPVYRSQAMVEIKGSMPDIVGLQQLQETRRAAAESVGTEVQTEVGILKSDNLARQVIDQLHLADQHRSGFSLSGLLGAGWRAVSKWWSGSAASPSPQIDAKAYEGLVDRFEASLNVENIGGSRLIKISYESDDPRLSARVVNALVSDYLQLHERATEKLTKMLAQEVQDARRELERSEAKMTQYANQNGLVFMQTNSGTSQNVADQRLQQIQGELTQAQADRYQKQSVYQLVQKGNYGSLPGIFQQKLLQDLTVQVADLKRQYAQLSATFTDSYPKVKQVKSQLIAMEKELARERARAAANVTDAYLAAVAHEALLVRAYKEQKRTATAVAQKSNQYNMLKRSADSDNQLYDDLLQKVKEASLVARLKANNVNVVDKAVPEFLPVRPRILLNLALSLILGLGLGIAIAFLRERLDTTLKSVEEVDRFLGVPALAMIPSVDSLPELVSNGNNHNGNGLMLPDVFDPSGLTRAEKPWYRIDKQVHQEYSPLVEAFRTLGSSVMLEAAGRKKVLRSIVITSSQPGEGKTTVSVNLAIALAQQGSRVILIDADLRRPSVHRALGFRNIRGLSGYLAGLSEWAPCVLPGLTPGLDTLPAGKSPRNPVALLSSPRMKVLIRQVLEEYDYLIIDSPALMPNLADARILAEMVDGSIMVVRSGMAPREFVIRSRKHLNNVFGVVLNSMDVRSMEDGYGYHSYGYGSGENEEQPEPATYEKRIAG